MALSSQNCPGPVSHHRCSTVCAAPNRLPKMDGAIPARLYYSRRHRRLWTRRARLYLSDVYLARALQTPGWVRGPWKRLERALVRRKGLGVEVLQTAMGYPGTSSPGRGFPLLCPLLPLREEFSFGSCGFIQSRPRGNLEPGTNKGVQLQTKRGKYFVCRKLQFISPPQFISLFGGFLILKLSLYFSIS